MKKTTILAATVLTSLILTGCDNSGSESKSKSVSEASKKEVTIKDIVEDKKMHLISQRTQETDDDGDAESYESNVFLTKDGKMKAIKLSGTDTTREFINKLKPENAERILDNQDLIDRETEWEEPMYVAIDNKDKEPMMTFVVPKSKEVKKDDVSTFEDYMSHSFEDDEILGINYTSVTSSQSQDPSKPIKYYGAFTYDGAEMNNSDVYESYGVELNKKQKVKSLTVSDIENMKNGYVYDFEDIE